jgi:hypothetical protein
MYKRIALITRPATFAQALRGDEPGPRGRIPPPPADLREADLVTAAGAIDRAMLMRIAGQRAGREMAGNATIGAPRAWRELFGEELRRCWSIAKMLRECRNGRDALAKMPPAEQRIRQLEFRLHKLRHGLATPPCAKTRDDIAHCEALLARAREEASMPQAANSDSRNRSASCLIPSTFSFARSRRPAGQPGTARAENRRTSKAPPARSTG